MFGNLRFFIQAQRNNLNREWESIKLTPFVNRTLKEFLDVQNQMGYSINKDSWFALVEDEKQQEEAMLKVEAINKQAIISEPGVNNELEVDNDLDSAWSSYKNKLKNKGFNETTIRFIQKTTTKILKRLSAKTQKTKPVKGLVIGNVQSGKTANMAALMSMAADNGWNFFIVLSGTIENLRKQTEDRLFCDLHNDNSKINWEIKSQLGSDNATGNNLQELSLRNNTAYFTVCLKNSTRLRNLLGWLKGDKNKLAQLKILLIDDESDQAGVNTANIDEEEKTTINNLISGLVYCDFNGRFDNQENKDFDDYHYCSMNYVGYTATPYANILNETPTIFENLYPSTFITTLPVSLEYFGPQQIFGLDGNEQFDQLDIVRIIKKKDNKQSNEIDDIDKIQDIHNGVSQELPKSLVNALEWFFCCVACRRIWKQNKPVTLLIHTNIKTKAQDNMGYSINNWILNKCKVSKENLINECEEVWNRETKLFNKNKLRLQFPNYGIKDEDINDYPNFYDVREQLRILFSMNPTYIKLVGNKNPIYHKGIHICIDNSTHNTKAKADESIRLIYPKDDLNFASAFIVIGGSTLARGLTLDGLVCSYFLRTTGQADTLMQMGRWFGYRKGYEILPRVWMSESSLLKFQFLSSLDYELRDEIQTMETKNYSPTEYGPRVLNTPDYRLIKITAKNKSQSAVEASWNFSGKTNQTFKFDNDRELLKHNIVLTENLVRQLGVPVQNNLNVNKHAKYDLIWRHVETSIVSDFLTNFHFNTADQLLQTIDLLVGWVEKNINDNNLDKWNVVFAGVNNKNNDQTKIWKLPNNLTLNKIERTKKNKEDCDKTINIGVLRTPGDMFADIDLENANRSLIDKMEHPDIKQLDEIREENGLGKTPLLIVYMIDKNSKVSKGAKEKRVDLNSVEDIVGICIYLPGEEKGKSYVTKLSIPLKHIQDDNGDFEA